MIDAQRRVVPTIELVRESLLIQSVDISQLSALEDGWLYIVFDDGMLCNTRISGEMGFGRDRLHVVMPSLKEGPLAALPDVWAGGYTYAAFTNYGAAADLRRYITGITDMCTW